jgi:hypothetical protein
MTSEFLRRVITAHIVLLLSVPMLSMAQLNRPGFRGGPLG